MQRSKKYIKLNNGERVTASGKVCAIDFFKYTPLSLLQTNILFVWPFIASTDDLLWEDYINLSVDF